MIILASDIGAFLGRFHPMIVHLPIGFITLATIMYFFSGRLKYEKLRSALSFVLLASAISAIVAAYLGWLLSGNGSYNPSVVSLHKWSGIALAPLSILSWWLYRKHMDTGQRPRYMSFLIYGMFAILMFNGHQGGSLTHGKNYLFEKAPAPIAALFGVNQKPEKIDLPSTDPDSVLVFNQIIHPFLIKNCQDCHNDKSFEGDLILTTLEGIKKGGSDGPAISAGNLKESGIFDRVTLPQSDLRFMPTSGKMPLTFHQIRILEWWIAGGADYEASLTDIPAPADIRILLESEYGIPAKPLDFVDKVKLAPVSDEAIQKAVNAGFRISPLAPGHPLLDVNIDDTEFDLNALEPLKDHITWLNLTEQNLDGKSLAILGQFQNLSRLKMDRCSLSDTSLEFLSGLTNLEYLNIYGNSLKDPALSNIAKAANLKRLFVWQNEFTDEGLAELQNALPEMEINNGFEFAEK